jgi:hypothetical protein
MVLIPLIKAITRKSDNQDAGYWINEVFCRFYKKKSEASPFSSNQQQISSIQYPETGRLFAQHIYPK